MTAVLYAVIRCPGCGATHVPAMCAGANCDCCQAIAEDACRCGHIADDHADLIGSCSHSECGCTTHRPEES